MQKLRFSQKWLASVYTFSLLKKLIQTPAIHAELDKVGLSIDYKALWNFISDTGLFDPIPFLYAFDPKEASVTLERRYPEAELTAVEIRSLGMYLRQHNVRSFDNGLYRGQISVLDSAQLMNDTENLSTVIDIYRTSAASGELAHKISSTVEVSGILFDIKSDCPLKVWGEKPIGYTQCAMPKVPKEVWQAVAKSQADAEKASGAIPGERTFSCGGAEHQNAPVTRYDLNEAIATLKKALHTEITELSIDLGQVEADTEELREAGRKSEDDNSGLHRAAHARDNAMAADIRRSAFNSELQELRHEVYDRLASLRTDVDALNAHREEAFVKLMDALMSDATYRELKEQIAAIERKLVGKYDATHMSKAYDSGYNRARCEAEDVPTPVCGFYDDQRPKPEGSILKQHEEFHRQSTPTPAASDSQTKQIGRVLEVAGGREALAKSLKYPAGKPAAPAPSVPACVGCKHTASKWNGDHFEDVEIKVNPGCPKHGKLQPAAPDLTAQWCFDPACKETGAHYAHPVKPAAPAKRITAEQLQTVCNETPCYHKYEDRVAHLAARINDFFGGK
jgi:hypothetical protein